MRTSEANTLGSLPEWVANPDPSIYLGDDYLVADFETTTVYKGSPLIPENRIVLACWRGSGWTDTRYTFGNEYEQGELIEAVNEARFVVAHNAKFELGWLRRCGVDLRKVITFDTLLADYVLGGNTRLLRQLSLNDCLARRGLQAKDDTVSKMIKAGVPMDEIPSGWLLRYCKRDVEAAEELFLLQRRELVEKGLAAVHYQRCLVTPALTDIEFNGLQLDEEKVNELVQEEEERYARITAELQDFCDGADPASPAQKCKFIYDTLGFEIPTDYRGRPLLSPKGSPSAAAPVLEKLVARTNRQREFLAKHTEWSNLHSDVTKYLRKFGECCAEAGGLLFAVFNQANTRTHRFSSSGLQYGVQFQNLNRSFKPLFRARRSGWLIGEADGAQLEFRVAVHLGRDKSGIKDIVEGVDIHAFTASIIQCSRQLAKSHTFKPLYGGKSGTEAERRYYEAFAEKYSGISSTQRRWTNCVLEHKELTTEWGLKYYWPDTRMTQSGYITNTTSIYNYPVQAFATAEIIPCALVAAWHRMKDWDGFLVNTVHDSIIAELPPNEVKAWHQLAQQALIEDTYELIRKLYGISITVPLGAGVTVGTHWGSKDETVYQADKRYWEEAAREAGMI